MPTAIERRHGTAPRTGTSTGGRPTGGSSAGTGGLPPLTQVEQQWLETGQRNPDGSIPQNQPGTLLQHGSPAGGGTYVGPASEAGVSSEADQFAQLIAAQEAERAAREARIAAAMEQINRVFGGRAGAFDRYADTSFDLNRERLQEDRGDTERQLKFALARAGTLGGSADVDRHAELDQRFDRSLADARSFADDQAAQLRAQEEAARANLMGVASSGNLSGAQVGSMAQNALGPTQSALRAPATMPNLGSNMRGIADVIGQALFAAGNRQGQGGGVPFGGDQFSSFFPRGKPGQREEGTIS